MSSESTTVRSDQDTVNRTAIINTVNQYFQSLDRREWETLRSCFAEGELAIDFTAMFGGEPTLPTADEQVERSRQLSGGFDATQHMVSSHVVAIDGDEATCETSTQVTMFLPNDRGDDFWEGAGFVGFDLVRAEEGWHIAGITMTGLWGEGNGELFALAPDRFEENEQTV
jgi:hypothetical protein